MQSSWPYNGESPIEMRNPMTVSFCEVVYSKDHFAGSELTDDKLTSPKTKTVKILYHGTIPFVDFRLHRIADAMKGKGEEAVTGVVVRRILGLQRQFFLRRDDKPPQFHRQGARGLNRKSLPSIKTKRFRELKGGS